MGFNIIIRIKTEINKKVHMEIHLLWEAEEGIPISLEEDVNIDLAEEDKKEMEVEMEQEVEHHNVIIAKKIGHLENNCYKKMNDLEHKGANIVV